MAVPRVPNPFEDDESRLARVEAHVATGGRRKRVLILGGVVALALWGGLVVAGYPGTGLVLVPIGIFMILGSFLEL